MNTESENLYGEIMTNDRIQFVTKETKNFEYDFQVTPQILEDFERWKLDTFELTDTLPTKLEELQYFQKLKLNKMSGSYGNHIEVTKVELIIKEDDILLNEDFSKFIK
jgi:hypothetical protein